MVFATLKRPEVRCLLRRLLWQWIPSPSYILEESYWRRRHQAIAFVSLQTSLELANYLSTTVVLVLLRVDP
ncbi:MAG TPA: hypothetical protein V6D09_07120 [Leptolyngbyaceae cyanobacterium]